MTSVPRVDGSGSDAGPAQQAVDEIGAAGGKAIASGADISDHAAAEDLIKTAIGEFGRLDVLVNVAGILRDRMVFNMTEREWDDVIRVHLKGTFNTTKFASAHWRSLRDQSAQNRIINFTLGLRPARRPRPAQLRRGEDGHRRADVLVCALAGQVRRDGERDLARGVDPDDPTRCPTGRRRARAASAGERSPDNVAPVVAYLASGAVGLDQRPHRAFRRLRGNRSTATPSRLIRVVGTEPWELDELADEVERSFGPLLGRPQ